MRRIGLAIAALLALLGAAGPAVALRLRISLAGSGSWATSLRGTSPNPGGAPDHNSGRDSSTQEWRLVGTGPLVITCRRACTAAAPREARGAASVTGHIDHRHVDGLYAFDTYRERCTLRGALARGQRVALPISAAIDRGTLVLTATDPLTATLEATPPQCPGVTDPLDGFPENMFTPGFSFASGWGPDRWFAAGPVRIPIDRLRRRPLSVRLGPARTGTPPRDCALRQPRTEQCRTGGTWRETLTLTPLSGR